MQVPGLCEVRVDHIGYAENEGILDDVFGIIAGYLKRTFPSVFIRLDCAILSPSMHKYRGITYQCRDDEQGEV
jgi:hypothetical protein